ncbi:MAG: tetratricopeptide repeat protein [Desulfomonile tiedjei]|nr:tetratricopeptide repeat protein [Desulfomonile tiedjei]
MQNWYIGIVFGVILLATVGVWQAQHHTIANAGSSSPQATTPDGYTGSVSCRKCHEKFYQLWAPSHHGLAMQPYTAELAKNRLTPQEQDIVIGDRQYRAEFGDDAGWVIERGPGGEKKFRIDHAMGGKNVYYFLTTLDRGRLQTLPVAYDVNKKEWLDMAASGVRHFPGQTDEPINWKDWQYTFNTACYGCHVSQVSTNYDLKTDTYHTVWREPGINCETCHGPADEHIRVCEAAPKGIVPKDLKITRGGRDFSKEQNNATCSSCHAKATVLTETFRPGDRFFDHFGLVTLESPDYYPDGRDLGENYTYTSWLVSPCVKSGKLDCFHCHTSSGRYKFKAEEKANQACMPCHQDKVGNPTEHTHHKADSPGNKCISCHMPMTEFARMRRSDHSMLPPTPAATAAFKSPNACNLCHNDQTTEWADEWVRKWRKRDYQTAVLHRAGLIDAARKRDWTKLPDMLDYVTSKDRDEVFATSLIRLVPASGDPRAVPALLKAIKDPSPLMRSAAAQALQNVSTEESVLALVEATGDEYRLVRVRAAASLAGYQNLPLTDADKKRVEAASKEYLASILSRPDQWDSHYNLGNYYLDRGDFKQAVASYDTALKMEPRGVLSMVNAAMAYARMGENQKANDALQKALKVAPDNAAANFNMGLLKAEENDIVTAEKHLRAALKADSQMAQAAYNLSVILSKDRIDEAVDLCSNAAAMRPDMPRYAVTLAFYQQQKGDLPGAASTLDGLITRYPANADAYVLLGGIYEKQGKKAEAEGVYNKGLAVAGMPDQYKIRMKVRLEALKGAPQDEPEK